MKNRFLLLCGVAVAFAVSMFPVTAQNAAPTPSSPTVPSSTAAAPKPPPYKGPKEAPSFADVAYGSDPKQKLDVYVPSGPGPFPIFLYFHGGGWFAGDKKTGAMEPEPLLKAGVAMVSAEYRVVSDAVAENISPPIVAVLGDNRRALQYVRLHAKDWNLDPDRIVVSGGSAGGGTAIYLGSEGEQASPNSPDPVERVSTKVSGVAGMAAAPTTIDPKLIREWNPGVIWGYWCFEPDPKSLSSQADFDKWLADRDQWLPYIEKYSSDRLLTKDAPPFYLDYGQTLPAPGTNPTSGELVHSPRWALAFQKLAQERGATVYVHFPGHPSEKYKNIWEFIYDRLGVASK
jgi:acetyl esterase/lipase